MELRALRADSDRRTCSQGKDDQEAAHHLCPPPAEGPAELVADLPVRLYRRACTHCGAAAETGRGTDGCVASQDKKASLAEGEKLESVSALTQVAKPAYQELSAEDKAALQERAEEQRRAYPAILDAWKKTLTPADIREENAVRTRRRKLGLSHKANLRLEGEPKKPMTPYFLCVPFRLHVGANGMDALRQLFLAWHRQTYTLTPLIPFLQLCAGDSRTGPRFGRSSRSDRHPRADEADRPGLAGSRRGAEEGA